MKPAPGKIVGRHTVVEEVAVVMVGTEAVTVEAEVVVVPEGEGSREDIRLPDIIRAWKSAW